MTLAYKPVSSRFLIVAAVFLCACVATILCSFVVFRNLQVYLTPPANASTFQGQLSATVWIVSPNPAVPLSSRLTRTHNVVLPLSSSSSNAMQEWFRLQFNTAKKLLCHSFMGRLGNELFQYASTLGLALTLNRTPVFLNAKHIPRVLKTFFVPSGNLSDLKTRCARARSAPETSAYRYTEKLAHLDPRYDYEIGTYLLSYRYFEKHQDYIRKAVTFSDAIRNESERFVRQLRQKYNSSTTLVGLHLRRGDQATERNRKNGHPLTTPDFINRSVAYFEKRYPNCVFAVASDSLQWCREHFPKGHKVVFSEKHAPAVDMMILASMDHTVISSGTFSWWVGYFNNGTTVYLKDFIIPNTVIGRLFAPRGEGYIYPGWIPV